jgi:hypothetical protein
MGTSDQAMVTTFWSINAKTGKVLWSSVVSVDAKEAMAISAGVSISGDV